MPGKCSFLKIRGIRKMPLSSKQIRRYSRHLVLPEVGTEGQEKLLNAKVLIVGLGGLGSSSAVYLASAGVGTLGLVDFDLVDLSNLQRQVIHSVKNVGKPKVESAKERITALNPDLNLNSYEMKLGKDNAISLIQGYDIVIDGSDNFSTRFLLNDACVFLKKPFVYGSVFRFEGQSSLFNAADAPCYRCLYPEPPPAGMVPSCVEVGVLGVLPGIIGLIQATECVKWIIGKGHLLTERLLLFNALEMKFREVKIEKDSDCPVCGKNPTITQLREEGEFCNSFSGNDSEKEITVKKLKNILDSKGKKILLIDVRESDEYRIANIQGAQLIPLRRLKIEAGKIDASKDIYVYCKTGGRSTEAVRILKELGFTKVKNVKGGIDAWRKEVDPSLPNY